ncbi:MULTISPECIES: type II toxin-antitoxin system ParD family antitoxin [Sphingomonas]|uniref:type II toxin-antitoxin system ParD family antitoxin n=1 Tax=Sphingomonas TaxID=13687 RepID=UPI001E3AD525|nr:type II toxin-antitoxin system ParD family antitoxin [Sphingomonas sp. CCH10-B3]
MTDMSFTMPPDLKSWIDAQVAQGRYADAGDYLRDLVRRDLETASDERAWLRAMIAEGLASGIIDRDARDVLDEIIAEDPDLRG